MKKIFALFLALLLFIGTITGYSFYLDKKLAKNNKALIYHNNDTRNKCIMAMNEVQIDNSILVFGSSELSYYDSVAYPPVLFKNGNSNFNMILYGRGYTQSIHHAITVGALGDNIKNKKVVLILSPQWFTESHLQSEQYVSRYYETMYFSFMNNKSLSDSLKEYAAQRMDSLLILDERSHKNAGYLQQTRLNGSVNIAAHIYNIIYEKFWDFRVKYELSNELCNELKSNSLEGEEVKIEELNFDKLLMVAEQQAKKECTNNNYYIYDDYFTTYLKPQYKASKNAWVNNSYTESKEYDDLRFFLKVCDELNIEVMLVSIPVNGTWYDYTGFPKNDRYTYYQNIRDIAKEYQVKLADFSNKEYEPYFLRDVMHLGWKGWVYVDEAVYDYFKQDKTE